MVKIQAYMADKQQNLEQMSQYSEVVVRPRWGPLSPPSRASNPSKFRLGAPKPPSSSKDLARARRSEEELQRRVEEQALRARARLPCCE